MKAAGFLIFRSSTATFKGGAKRSVERVVVLPGDVVTWKRGNRTSAIGTITGRDHHALTTAWLTKFYGTSTAAELEEPLATVTAGGGKGGGHHALTAAFLTKFQQNSPGQSLDGPMHTVMAGAPRFAQVQAFLLKWYGAKSGQHQDARDPLHTITSRARFGLVTIEGEDYAIADIGMRMLQPHELYAAQGFPEDYVIGALDCGKPITKTAQIKLVGNSVCPPVAEALVAAQVRGGAVRAA